MKIFETIAINFLLKRGYQVAYPMITFSQGNDKVWTSATYWQPKSSPTKEGERDE